MMSSHELTVTPTSGQPRRRMETPIDVVALASDMAQLEQEHLRVLLLNTRNELLREYTLYVGTLRGVSVRVGEIFREAIRANADAIALVHNHVSGDPEPSPEDLYLTREVARAGQLLDVRLLDHIVVGNPTRLPPYVSLRERGVLNGPMA